MVKQYVGARYVPKLANPVEWASNTSYEALTIVTFNNASYTSKVPVPPTVGNPANNPQYWALTGNYNAQVEQYRQETETVSNNLTTLQGQITTEITNRENADTTLQNNIGAEATARQTANNILQGNINSEAKTRASADSNLQSQINQIIAPSGEAPSAAEVQNARIGADGVTYPTLGDAIRMNDTELKNQTDAVQNKGLYICNLAWEHGGIAIETGQNTDDGSLTRSRTPDYLWCADYVKITNDTGAVAYLTIYDSSKSFIKAYQVLTQRTVSIATVLSAVGLANDVTNSYFRIDLRSGLQDTNKVLVYQYASYVGAVQAASNGAVFRRLSSVMFERGGLKTSTGEETTSNTFIRTAFIPIVAGMTIQVSNLTNSDFHYTIHQYDSSKTWINVLTLVNKSANSSFTFATNCSYIRIMLNNKGFDSITPSDVGDALISFKWLYNTATTYREPFAYLTDNEKFIFYNEDIFNAVGRCAWRISDSIGVKLPNKAVVFFTNDQIISALDSEDIFTDANSTSWVYLRPGRALIYDDATGVLSSVAINAKTPLTDKAYPLIMMWSGQAVGGMLFDKFLYDVHAVAINKVANRMGSIAAELNNSRHIAHSYNAATPTALTLLHFSDPHADASAMRRILKKANALSNLIDDIICTGDMVANTYASITSWWNPAVMTCIGNHDSAAYDSNTGYNWTALSMADRDAYYIAPFESGWGIVHTAGTSYYYKDYTSQKVRLIVMDCMLYMSASTSAEATAQTAWLAHRLSDAITNGLHVLIAIHAPHGGATAEVCSFSKYGQGVMPTYGDCNTPQTVIDTVNTAITNGLHFIGYLVGHTHQDNMWDATGNGSQMMYCVTCAAVAQTAQWVDSDQHRSETEDAYNLVTIDTEHTLVKIVRGGGADIDDHMRTRKAICFNYSTGKMVGEVL